MHRLPPSVCHFLDLEADIEDDDEERNSEEGEEEEEEEEQALQSASSFLLHIKYHITNYILQIISLTIVHGPLQISQTPDLTNPGTILLTLMMMKRSLAIS